MNETRLSLTEVAQRAGMSPQNLHKTYVKKGKMTVKRDEKNRPYVELVECLRVFGNQFGSIPAERPVDGNRVDTKVDTVDFGLSEVINRNNQLEAKVEELSRQLADAKEQVMKAEDRETWLRGQVDKLTDTIKLLEGPKREEPPAPAEKPGFFARLFGRN